jgi:hypothetical protein
MLALLALAGAGLPGFAQADVTSTVRSGSSASRVVVRTVARKSGKPQGDPFDDSAGGETVVAAGKGKGKASDDSAKSEKSGSKTGSSSDPLDNLLNDAVSDKGSKGKKQDKEMDALLKDVQKADATPAPKKDSGPSAPPLSPADISTAMAQVKVRGNACAQKFGRAGTAELKITVARDGKVTDVQVGGKLMGSPVAGCIEQAVKTAAFRPNAGLRFDYRMDVR